METLRNASCGTVDSCFITGLLEQHNQITSFVAFISLLQGAPEIKMKRVSLLCLYALVTLCTHKGVLSAAPSYGERGSDLGIQVFQQVVRSKPLENVVLSPHGVASILGMLLPGAQGDTRKQIISALRYKKNGKEGFRQEFSVEPFMI